ncbi:MAG: hypothetical protein ACJAYR_002313 [Sneathiella sp.]|jgi:hypothetical protein
MQRPTWTDILTKIGEETTAIFGLSDICHKFCRFLKRIFGFRAHGINGLC